MNHYDLSSWAWSQGGQLTAPEKILLHGLIHHCRGGKAYCWPSRERLQTLVGFCSPQEVSRHLRGLVRKNVITPYEVERSSGGGHHKGWRILADGCGNPHFGTCRNPHKTGTHTNIGNTRKKGREKPGLENQAGIKPPAENSQGGKEKTMLKTSGKKGTPVKGFGLTCDVLPAGLLEPSDIDELVQRHQPEKGPWRKGMMGPFWLSLLGTVFPKETHPEYLNSKEAGQLWTTLTGWDAKEEESAAPLLADVVRFWQKFTDEVKFREGVQPAARPSIGFLTKYRHIAWDLRVTLAGLKAKQVHHSGNAGIKQPGGTVQLIAQTRRMSDNVTNTGTSVPEPPDSDEEHYALDGTKVTKW